MKSLGQFSKFNFQWVFPDTLYRPCCVINEDQQHQSACHGDTQYASLSLHTNRRDSPITYPRQHRWDCLDFDDVLNDYQV